MRHMRLCRILLYQRVHHLAQHFRNRTFCLNEDIQLLYHPTLSHLYGSYLYDIIFKDIQARGLSIKHHHILFLIDIDKLTQIGRTLIVQEINRRQGQFHYLTHKLTRGTI